MMARTLIAALIGVGIPLSLQAAEPNRACNTIRDPMLRVDCYDKEYGLNLPPESEKPKPQPSDSSGAAVWLKNAVKVRDEITPDGLGSDPASITFGTQDGEHFSAVKAAVLVKSVVSPFPEPLASYGWGIFGAASMDRNTLTDDRVNVWNAKIGVSGQISDSVYSAISYGHQRDQVKDTASQIGLVDQIVTLPWLTYFNPNSHAGVHAYPRFGYMHQRIIHAAEDEPKGRLDGAYIGFYVQYRPGDIFGDRVLFSGYAQRFVDFADNGGIPRRHDNYFKISAEYLLAPYGSDVLPSLALERQVGADPLSGTDRHGITTLSLRLKVN